jgi:hypothetical protein
LGRTHDAHPSSKQAVCSARRLLCMGLWLRFVLIGRTHRDKVLSEPSWEDPRNYTASREERRVGWYNAINMVPGANLRVLSIGYLLTTRSAERLLRLLQVIVLTVCPSLLQLTSLMEQGFREVVKRLIHHLIENK